MAFVAILSGQNPWSSELRVKMGFKVTNFRCRIKEKLHWTIGLKFWAPGFWKKHNFRGAFKTHRKIRCFLKRHHFLTNFELPVGSFTVCKDFASKTLRFLHVCNFGLMVKWINLFFFTHETIWDRMRVSGRVFITSQSAPRRSPVLSGDWWAGEFVPGASARSGNRTFDRPLRSPKAQPLHQLIPRSEV